MTSPVNVSSGDSLSADSAAEWLQLHGKRIGTLAVAAAVLGGGFWFYRYNRAQNEVRGERQYYEAEQSLVAGNYPLATSDLQKVVTQFDGTKAADQARLGLAQALYGQGKNAEGIAALKPVAEGSGLFAPAARALTAAGYENLGKAKEAADEYRSAADVADLATEKSIYLSEAARTYTAAGTRDSAIAIWTRLSEDLSSSAAAEARVRLGELTAKPASR